MHLARFPRVRLFPTPTPLEPLENLSRHLGGPEIWIKRDDCTVVATGGNKVRKLEFLVGEAQGAGRRPSGDAGRGAVQPRAPDRRGGETVRHEVHRAAGASDRDQRSRLPEQRQCAAGSAVRQRRSSTGQAATDMNAEIEAKGAALREAGEKPYVIPGGGSNRVGALGYVVMRAGTDAAGR